MDKSEGKDWFAKTLNNVTEETAKVYKISRLKLEINSFNKTYNEKMHKISKRLLQLIQQGEIDASLFEPEYSSIMQIAEKIEEMETEIEAIKGNLKFGFNKKKSDNENEKKADEQVVDVKTENIEDEGKKEDNK